MLTNMREHISGILASGSTDNRRPMIRKGNESNIKGLHIIGDLAGATVIKLAMTQGVEVIDYLASRPEMQQKAEGDMLDVLVVGAGAAGLNAALAAKDRGWRCVVVEKGRIANTIEDFPEGKWIYAEPDAKPAKGKLWLDGATKEDLIRRWHQIIEENAIDIRSEQPLVSLKKQGGVFIATTSGGKYRTKKVVLATGQRGHPRRLGVGGEDIEQIYHRLYSPRKYKNERILVVGGGNSAVEAALTLCKQNDVVLSYRKGEFVRLFKDNMTKVNRAISQNKIKVLFNSNVQAFRPGEARLEIDRGGHHEERVVTMDYAFVLIGSELPARFLKSLGIRLENEWEGRALPSVLVTVLIFAGLWFLGPALTGTSPFGINWGGAGPILGVLVALFGLAGLLAAGIRGNRWAFLGASFVAWYSIYGIKVGKGAEFWPFRGWGYESLSVFDRSWAFWYTVLYTTLMTVFGLAALKRWGLDRRDKFQIWRFTSLLGFQWICFFIIPEFLFQWAVQCRWVGEGLAADPNFADQAWRSYGIVYAWPLFFYTWFYDPHTIWVVWGVILTFLIIPISVLMYGKRYCSWICGCGGLAETFGDRWRHLAPKGKPSIGWEWMGTVVLIFAAVVTLIMLLKDVTGLIRTADWGVYLYGILCDVWLVGILPVTLYPFMGGKIWCRYWCPLAKMMQFLSKLYTKIGISRFQIVADDKCIACNECSRNCQVGIDVMQYALKQETLDNGTSSCIGCGICVSVCPMDTLSFSGDGKTISLTVAD